MAFLHRKKSFHALHWNGFIPFCILDRLSFAWTDTYQSCTKLDLYHQRVNMAYTLLQLGNQEYDLLNVYCMKKIPRYALIVLFLSRVNIHRQNFGKLFSDYPRKKLIFKEYKNRYPIIRFSILLGFEWRNLRTCVAVRKIMKLLNGQVVKTFWCDELCKL